MNNDIRVPKVRLIDKEGEQVGILNTAEAMLKAKEDGLDLVEISPNAEPPVCRIMDYGRYLFDIKKRKSAQRKKQKVTQVKEIKFRPTTDVGDYKVKLRKITEFLENGDKVKITIRFRGREMQHRELGMDLLKRVEQDISELGKVEQFPRLEGRQLSMVIAPIKKQ